MQLPHSPRDLSLEAELPYSSKRPSDRARWQAIFDTNGVGDLFFGLLRGDPVVSPPPSAAYGVEDIVMQKTCRIDDIDVTFAFTKFFYAYTNYLQNSLQLKAKKGQKKDGE